MTNKLDAALVALVAAAEAHAELGDGKPFEPLTVKVLVELSGDLAAVEGAGFVAELDTGRIVVGTAAVADFERIAALDEVVSLHSSQTFRPMDADAPAARVTASGQGVVVGIVDDGVDIFHPSFRADGHTRFSAIIDLTLTQSIKATPNLTTQAMLMRWDPPRTERCPTPRQVTATLPFPITATAVLDAWEAQVPEIESGDIVVTGGPFPTAPLTIRFGGKYNTDSEKVTSADIPDIVCLPSPAQTGPAQFSVTRVPLVLDHATIDHALQTGDHTFPVRASSRHGTRVAAIAAGAVPAVPAVNACLQPPATHVGGIAPGSDLVFVHTPFDTENILHAVTYVLDFAAQAQKPVVVNLSIGQEMHPHDGTDIFSLYLDSQLGDSLGRAIVCAAGNEGGLYATSLMHQLPPYPHYRPKGGQHVQGTIPAGGTATLRLLGAPEDSSPEHFQIWYHGPGKLAFDLTTPQQAGGHSMPTPVQPPPVAGSQEVSATLDGHAVTVISQLGVLPSNKNLINVRVAPSPVIGVIADGLWTVLLKETGGAATHFDCWIQSDVDAFRFLLEEQDRTRTLATPGVARNTITVGAYDNRSGELWTHSSRGPTTDGRDKPKPEVCAPGVAVWTANALAQNDNWFSQGNGTSYAAPYVTGVVALMLEVNPQLTYADIRKRLQDTCDPPVPTTPPTDLTSGWGYGRVNPQKAVEAALAPAAADAGPVVLPPAAYPALSLPMPTLIEGLRERAEQSAAGRTLALLAARHAQEVRRLIAAERRVTVAWQRMHGPDLVTWVLSDVERDVPLPRLLGGLPLAAGLDRLCGELDRAGSAALREDIAAYRSLLLALPGRTLSELDELDALDHERVT